MQQPIDHDGGGEGDGRGDAEDVIDPGLVGGDAGGLPFKGLDAVGADVVVPRAAEDHGDGVLLVDAHGGEADRAVVIPNDGDDAILKDHAFQGRLRPFGEAFVITHRQFDAMVDAIDFDAAIGVPFVDGELHGPDDLLAEQDRAGGGEWGHRADGDGLFGEMAGFFLRGGGGGEGRQ